MSTSSGTEETQESSEIEETPEVTDVLDKEYELYYPAMVELKRRSEGSFNKLLNETIKPTDTDDWNNIIFLLGIINP